MKIGCIEDVTPIPTDRLVERVTEEGEGCELAFVVQEQPWFFFSICQYFQFELLLLFQVDFIFAF